jgi:hypothetical protein
MHFPRSRTNAFDIRRQSLPLPLFSAPRRPTHPTTAAYKSIRNCFSQPSLNGADFPAGDRADGCSAMIERQN